MSNRGKVSIVERKLKHPYIVKDPSVCDGSPAIKGTRIRVIDVAIEYSLLGVTPDEIVDSHPHLTLKEVHDALSYYYENKSELDKRYKDNKEFIEKVRKLYPSRLGK